MRPENHDWKESISVEVNGAWSGGAPRPFSLVLGDGTGMSARRGRRGVEPGVFESCSSFREHVGGVGQEVLGSVLAEDKNWARGRKTNRTLK